MNKYIYGKHRANRLYWIRLYYIIRVKLKLDQCEQINQAKKKAKKRRE